MTGVIETYKQRNNWDQDDEAKNRFDDAYASIEEPIEIPAIFKNC